MRSLFLVTFAFLLSGCGKPIAPSCVDFVCAEVEISSALSCVDPIAQQQFSLTQALSGRTKQAFCGVDGADLRLRVQAENDTNLTEFGFTLRGYTGPGSYELYNRADELTHLGLIVGGRTSRPPGNGNAEQVVGSNSCQQAPACVAQVAEGSMPIPRDPSQTHEFRVAVEVHCEAGATLTDILCDADHTRCTFDSVPTFRVEFLCSN